MTAYDFDIVVVGGGPAGSSAASEAARAGASVALVEKENAIADTVRTSGVTWIQNVKEFGIPADCFNPVRSYAFCSPKNTVTISGDAPSAAVLDVRKTYRWLARQAQEHGAELFLNTSIKDAIRDGRGDIAGVAGTRGRDNIEFRAKVVIDASGFASVVGRTMNLVPQWRRFGAGAEFEATAENVDPDTLWLMVGQRYSPSGYAWIFPVSRDTVRIGVGIGKPESAVDPTERLKEIMGSKEGPIESLGRITPVEFHYGLIPNDGLSRKTVYNNLMLVGDSAGQANPLVLEGIRYAIKFGRTAGRVAAEAISRGSTDEAALLPYEKAWKESIQSKIRSAGRVQDRWIKLTDKEWDAELDIIRDLSPGEFLDFIRADFTLSMMVRLAARHPKMAARQLFRLVKPG